jgi:multidrug efflux system membrane fusion protein
MTRLRFVAIVVALGLVAVVAWRLQPRSVERPEASRAVPVVAGKATAQDVPVYVIGLGTVQAYNTVTIKTRVDGEIMDVMFDEGQEVKAGEPLFQIDPRPYQAALDRAEASLQRDQAQLEAAKGNLTRDTDLLKKGFQTQQAFDDQKATVDQLDASIKGDKAQIETERLNLDYATVKAPIDGRTGARLVDAGNLVQANQGTNLVTITQMKPIVVSFAVPQASLGAIRQAQQDGTASVVAYGQDDKTVLGTGKLTLVNNQVDGATGTIKLKATFANADERLWPGAFVNARLILRVRKDAITVPAQTVMQGPDGPYVYVIKPDETVERKPVQVAVTQDGIAVIGHGLAVGEPVVVDGQYRLTNGSKVKLSVENEQQADLGSP